MAAHAMFMLPNCSPSTPSPGSGGFPYSAGIGIAENATTTGPRIRICEIGLEAGVRVLGHPLGIHMSHHFTIQAIRRRAMCNRECGHSVRSCLGRYGSRTAIDPRV